MTSEKPSKDRAVLLHNKYIAYLQIFSALCIGLIAGQYFKLFEIYSNFFGVIIFNNYVLAIILGFIGFLYFRKKLENIEEMV
ncbi:MAG: hypothetical protein COT15_01225 [Candidatus Diapherotrites archaeon CG08_land_8_20_14_0_20_34_12]|nr:MAG: hypothetical protein COT15_01225 [Candidatus Diapherotrites archaeon CG08_land_8_20_14_0_20_34_12]